MKQAEGKHVNIRHGSTRVWMCAGHLRVRVAASPSYDMCRDSQHDQIWFPWLRMPHFKAAAPEFLYLCSCQRARISIYPILCFAASVPIRDACTSAFLLWIIEDTRSFRVCPPPPHNKAHSSIFNAAETTTSTQSEPGGSVLQHRLPYHTSGRRNQKAQYGMMLNMVLNTPGDLIYHITLRGAL